MIPTTEHLRDLAGAALVRCGAAGLAGGDGVPARTPITGEPLGVTPATGIGLDAALDRAATVFATWRTVPAPARGDVVRRFGNLVREHVDDLATLIAVEVGKIAAEARGEVQEVVDVCDFAVGLSRQLYGRSIASERPAHRLTETWQPLGPVGVVTAFNFPAALDPQRRPTSYQTLRRHLGRVILLGLEILIIGDIVRTIVVEPTFESVLVLGMIVLIRIVLSFALEVEVDGHWPWSAARDTTAEQRERPD